MQGLMEIRWLLPRGWGYSSKPHKSSSVSLPFVITPPQRSPPPLSTPRMPLKHHLPVSPDHSWPLALSGFQHTARFLSWDQGPGLPGNSSAPRLSPSSPNPRRGPDVPFLQEAWWTPPPHQAPDEALSAQVKAQRLD